MLDVSIMERGGTVWLSLSGRMDGGPRCQSLRSTVKAQIGEGHRNFIFDLENLVSMSSRGIGCLVASYASIQGVEGTMALRAPNERVRHVLEVVRLLPEVLTVIDEAPPTLDDTQTFHGEDNGR